MQPALTRALISPQTFLNTVRNTVRLHAEAAVAAGRLTNEPEGPASTGISLSRITPRESLQPAPEWTRSSVLVGRDSCQITPTNTDRLRPKAGA